LDGWWGVVPRALIHSGAESLLEAPATLTMTYGTIARSAVASIGASNTEISALEQAPVITELGSPAPSLARTTPPRRRPPRHLVATSRPRRAMQGTDTSPTRATSERPAPAPTRPEPAPTTTSSAAAARAIARPSASLAIASSASCTTVSSTVSSTTTPCVATLDRGGHLTARLPPPVTVAVVAPSLHRGMEDL